MSSELFRREALEARRQGWLGHVQVLQPYPVKATAYFTVFLMLMSVIYIVFGVYTRRVHATGSMLPPNGLTTVDVNTNGLILAQNVEEGQFVHKGDTLFTIDIEATSNNGATQLHVIEKLKKQRDILQKQRDIKIKNGPLEKAALANQIRFLMEQRNEIFNQIRDDNRYLPVVQAAVRRMQSARLMHLVTETQFQGQLYTYAQLLNSHAQSLQSMTTTEGKVAEETSKLIRYDIQQSHDLNDLDKEILDVDQRIIESESRRSNVILAPEDGILTAVRISKGQHVQAGQKLVTLLPTGRKLEALLYVNSSSIGFIKEGEPVLLRYDAYPYQRFGLYRGHISEITRAPITITNPDDATIFAQQTSNKKNNSDSERKDLYRIKVDPDQQFVVAYGKHMPLQAGMAVTADIGIDTRSLFQWLFDPVMSARDDIYMISGGIREQ